MRVEIWRVDTPQSSFADNAQAAADRLAQHAAETAETYVDQLAHAAAVTPMRRPAARSIPSFSGWRFSCSPCSSAIIVVWAVTPALHTPLMSVTNAISSVIVVGALLSVGVDVCDADGDDGSISARIFGFIALVLASVNIFGGFLVTARMLAMYKKKG